MKLYGRFFIYLIIPILVVFSLLNCSGSKVPIVKKKEAAIVKKKGRVTLRTMQKPMIVLKNVKFRYTEDIYVLIDEFVGSILPRSPYRYINFDNIKSNKMDIHYATILLESSVMDTIFNTRIYNYKGSPLRNQKTSIIEVDVNGKKERRLKIAGEMKLLTWMSFEMTAKVMLDKERNLMIIEAEKIKSMGLPFVKGLMGIVFLNMEKLLTLKDGLGVKIKGNSIIVEPFTILPLPETHGFLSSVELQDKGVVLHVGQKLPLYRSLMPVKHAKNYIFIYKGRLTFARNLTMQKGRLMMIDKNPADFFDFYQRKYLLPLIRGTIKQRFDGSLIVYMPDYSSVAPKKKAVK